MKCAMKLFIPSGRSTNFLPDFMGGGGEPHATNAATDVLHRVRCFAQEQTARDARLPPSTIWRTPMSKKSNLIAIAAAAYLMLPIAALAQGAAGSAGGSTAGATSGSPTGTPSAGSAGTGTTGVSGVPAGPGNAGGNNNSVNDPSGVGNASKVPPLPNSSTSSTGPK
jgi:hypothetical protein